MLYLEVYSFFGYSRETNLNSIMSRVGSAERFFIKISNVDGKVLL